MLLVGIVIWAFVYLNYLQQAKIFRDAPMVVAVPNSNPEISGISSWNMKQLDRFKFQYFWSGDHCRKRGIHIALTTDLAPGFAQLSP